MNENPDTTGCDGMAVRPTKRDMIPMMGVLVAAFPVQNLQATERPWYAGELWYATGSGSDLDGIPQHQIFRFHCLTGGIAAHVAKIHRNKWGIPVYTTLPADYDGIPMAHIDGGGWDPII